MDISRGRLTDDTVTVHTPCVHAVRRSYTRDKETHAPYAHYTHVRTRRDDRRSRAVRSIDELSPAMRMITLNQTVVPRSIEGETAGIIDYLIRENRIRLEVSPI